MIPLFSTEQIRNADKYAIEKLKIPSITLMENAAINIYQAILSELPELNKHEPISILCGKGNNGGDGFALARHFVNNGFIVNVLSLGNEKSLTVDAAINFKTLNLLNKENSNLTITIYKTKNDLKNLSSSQIIIDALLGTGAKGELREPYNEIVKYANKVNTTKVAIDSPTGLNLENSTGEIIFNSDLTVTLAELKTGLFYYIGKKFAGKVRKGSIGIGNEYFEKQFTSDYLIEPEDALKGIPVKESDVHKYSAGKVSVIAGSDRMPGAGIFAINAAMISGAGSGYLICPGSIKHLAQAQMNSAIVKGFNDQESGILTDQNVNEIIEETNSSNSILIGPGIGRQEETQNAIRNIVTENKKKNIIIDADAIFALSNRKYKKFNLENSVLTPHHKEFADLLGIELDELQSNLISYGRKFVSETKSFLVLKGAPTIIFSNSGEVFINSVGNPGLAKFGSGDVLSGIITSFIAQNKEIENSIISAVYLHSLTADLIAERESDLGITPLKLIENFPYTVKLLKDSLVV